MNLNTGEPWSEMDLEDALRLAHGKSIEELADFLCRDVEGSKPRRPSSGASSADQVTNFKPTRAVRYLSPASGGVPYGAVELAAEFDCTACGSDLAMGN